jgi:predicted nucleic acid-binding protein
MNSMNAVDTNVYVYALDGAEPVKQAKAIELFDRLMRNPDETVLLWQVAGELLNQLRRWESKGRFSAMFELRLPAEQVFRSTFSLRAHHHLSHWDSMLLAACLASGVTTLYSEDLTAGMDYDGVRVVNPFA